MTPRRLLFVPFLAGVVAVALGAALILMPRGSSSEDAPAQPAVAQDDAPIDSVSREVAADTPDDGLSDGIKVHGHWTIEVREPDGSLVQRHEFENALTEHGEEVLVSLLTGGQLYQTSTNEALWFVVLDSAFLDAPCSSSSGSRTECVMVNECDTSTFSCAGAFETLTVASIGLGVGTTDPPMVKLSGDVQAAFDGSVSVVSTLACCLFTPVEFTSKNLVAPVAVKAGQSIHVTVEISFS